MKVLIDMNLAPAWATFLSSQGIDAVHWSAIGTASAHDVDIASFAKANAMTLMTSDLDFGRIAFAVAEDAPSVVLLRVVDDRVQAVGGRVVTVLQNFEEELMAGALLLLEDSRVRVRPYVN